MAGTPSASTPASTARPARPGRKAAGRARDTASELLLPFPRSPTQKETSCSTNPRTGRSGRPSRARSTATKRSPTPLLPTSLLAASRSPTATRASPTRSSCSPTTAPTKTASASSGRKTIARATRTTPQPPGDRPRLRAARARLRGRERPALRALLRSQVHAPREGSFGCSVKPNEGEQHEQVLPHRLDGGDTARTVRRDLGNQRDSHRPAWHVHDQPRPLPHSPRPASAGRRLAGGRQGRLVDTLPRPDDRPRVGLPRREASPRYVAVGAHEGPRRARPLARRLRDRRRGRDRPPGWHRGPRPRDRVEALADREAARRDRSGGA